MRIAALVCVTWVTGGVVAAACSPFRPDSGASVVNELMDATSATEATGELDGGAPRDFGCSSANVRTDLSAPPSAPFALLGGPMAWMRDEAGPYAEAVLTSSDGGVPPPQQYAVDVDVNATSICVSARVRVIKAPPADTPTLLLAAMVEGPGGTYGTSYLAMVPAPIVVVGWKTPSDAGMNMLPLGDMSSWHVVRVEMNRGLDGVWRGKALLDGISEIVDQEQLYPSEAIFLSRLVFGANTDHPLAPDAKVQVDFADVRAAWH
jgi:hypothetical protein